ncbi:alpha/beta fold hydrolase [Solihabitans fulvus]|uniref:Alpha/beta fold hydrolase n=1 Tax=Solihabitans fulvus TaxID=1892852 RepID=A0A5B2WWB4_9PSEU|nr:condensation domain-containing protein [Solihabitans fulvus]KAA2255358.1 alpha/beta fold hydrolase [Solihabitans fulvus]
MTEPRFPATPTQEALWWVHQRAARKSLYHITWRLGCAVPPDLSVLRGAWRAVVDRHEALRMSIDLLDGEVATTVLPSVAVPVRSVEIDDPGSTPVATLLALIAEETHDEPMPLDRAPLARLTAVRVGAEHELVLTVHHCAVDGWSIQVLMADLSTAYAALSRGAPPCFEKEPGSFLDFARDLCRARDRGRWQKTLDYWRATLDGATGVTVAPDRPGRDTVGGPGSTVRYEFSREAVDGLAHLAKAAQTTPFAVVLAAVQIVLARGGGGRDVAVGVVAANRMTGRDLRLVGYLANVCVTRARIADDDTVAAVVGRARETQWQVLTHQGVPYPVVHAELPAETSAALGDIPPVLLNYLGPIGADLRLGDVPLALRRSPNRAARTDLTIGYWDGDGLLTEVEYDVDRYDRATVLRLLHDVDLVLSSEGDRQVSAIGLRTRSAARHRPAPAEPTAAEPAQAAPPQSAVSADIGRAWAEVLGHAPTGPDVDFFADGGGSLKVLQLAAAIEAATGARLELVDWLAEPTPRRIAEQLAGGGHGGSVRSTLVTLREGAGPHLHLVHGAGGAAHDYRDLVAALPPHWRVTLSQDRTGADSVPAMAAAYLADLDAAGQRPDVLGGWSFGGMVAAEMAAACPGPPPGLVVIDSPPPVGYPVDEDAVREQLTSFAAMVGQSLDLPPDAASPIVSPHDPELTVRVLAACLTAAGEPVPAQALVERWRAYHRHSLAGAGHVTDRRLPTASVVVGADLTDAQLGQWAERLTPTPCVLRVASDHFGAVRAPAVAEIAAAVERLAARLPQP